MLNTRWRSYYVADTKREQPANRRLSKIPTSDSTMSLRIIINNKECTSPIVKFGLAIAVLIGAIVIGALIVYVLLPIIGISIAATLGLFIVVTVGIIAAAIALTLGSAILSAVILFAEFIAGKFRR